MLSSLCCLVTTSRLVVEDTIGARHTNVAGQFLLPVAACRLLISNV